MDKNRVVQVYYGAGKGKTNAAVGQCIRGASQDKDVIMIQFLKGKSAEEFSFLRNLEPQIKLFRFEKETDYYEYLPEERKKEERQNILNGFHFARKVVETGECDVLVLDEVLGLIDLGIIDIQDVIELINAMDENFKLIMTGKRMPEELMPYVDILSEIHPVKDTTLDKDNDTCYHKKNDYSGPAS